MKKKKTLLNEREHRERESDNGEVEEEWEKKEKSEDDRCYAFWGVEDIHTYVFHHYLFFLTSKSLYQIRHSTYFYFYLHFRKYVKRNLFL